MNFRFQWLSKQVRLEHPPFVETPFDDLELPGGQVERGAGAIYLRPGI